MNRSRSEHSMKKKILLKISDDVHIFTEHSKQFITAPNHKKTIIIIISIILSHSVLFLSNLLWVARRRKKESLFYFTNTIFHHFYFRIYFNFILTIYLPYHIISCHVINTIMWWTNKIINTAKCILTQIHTHIHTGSHMSFDQKKIFSICCLHIN